MPDVSSTLEPLAPIGTGGWASRQVAAMAAAWGRGERVTAFEILRDHPEVGDEDAIRLIFEETLLRREAGLDVDSAEVVRQFPRWAAELRALFDCDRLLRPGGASAGFPEVGERLGTFLLSEELGRGASGRTYLAADQALAGRPVVLKVIPGDQDEHLTARQAPAHAHRPAFLGTRLPRTGPARDLHALSGGDDPGRAAGGDRRGPARSSATGPCCWRPSTARRAGAGPRRPSRGPFRRGLERASYSQAILWIAACLADALEYAHARGLVHMDVKPSNVLIAADGQPMLLDFHLARGPIRAGGRVADRLGGTPGWMAPEQAAAMVAAGAGSPVPAAVDARADIYAMGLLPARRAG